MDPIANMLVQIKNAQAVKKDGIVVPFSKMKFQIAGVLKDAGFIADIERKNKPARPGKTKKSEFEVMNLTLKYDDNGGVINGIKIVSRPSRRLYMKASEIRPVRSGYGIAVLSTPKGILSSKEAKKQNVGGEILFEIW